MMWNNTRGYLNMLQKFFYYFGSYFLVFSGIFLLISTLFWGIDLYIGSKPFSVDSLYTMIQDAGRDAFLVAVYFALASCRSGYNFITNTFSKLP